MTDHHRRRSIFIDWPIQSALLLRALLYGAVSLMTQILVIVLFVLVTSSDDFYTNGARLWWHMQLSVVASAVVLPVILLDILKLSHRWVGPLFRLRASLHSLSRGKPVPPIQFREGDFWQELAGDLNAVTVELNRHRAASREDDVVGSPPSTNALEASGMVRLSSVSECRTFATEPVWAE